MTDAILISIIVIVVFLYLLCRLAGFLLRTSSCVLKRGVRKAHLWWVKNRIKRRRLKELRKRAAMPPPRMEHRPSPRIHSIRQSDFERIAYKTTYRMQRVETVTINDNQVSITVKSQSGNSKWSMKITFSLSGPAYKTGDHSSIGDFHVTFCENQDSEMAVRIGEKIKSTIRSDIGLN